MKYNGELHIEGDIHFGCKDKYDIKGNLEATGDIVFYSDTPNIMGDIRVEKDVIAYKTRETG